MGMENKIHIGKHTSRLLRRIKIADSKPDGTVIATGHTSEACGTRTADLELIIDIPKLIRMLGDRAILSKGRKVTIQSGAIVFRVVKGSEKDSVHPHVCGPRCYANGELICGILDAREIAERFEN